MDRPMTAGERPAARRGPGRPDWLAIAVARRLRGGAIAEGALLPAGARGNGTPACGGWVRRARGPGLSEEAAPVLGPHLGRNAAS